MAASSLDAAAARWANRCLNGPGGIPAWEVHGQNVGDGVHHWSKQLTVRLREIGANPGERYIQSYLTRTVDAATKGKYRDGVEEAAREDRWRAGFLAGISR